MANIDALMDRWMNDLGFRAALRRDPEGAVRTAGFTLSEDEAAALRSIDWSLTDEQLAARVSRFNI